MLLANFQLLFQSQTEQARTLIRSLDEVAADASERAARLEQISRSMVRVCTAIATVCQEEWDILWSGEPQDTETVGRILREKLQQVAEEFHYVRHCLPILDDRECALPGCREFQVADRQVRDLLEQLVRDWPWVDYQMMDESSAAGEFIDIEEAIRDAQDSGGGPRA